MSHDIYRSGFVDIAKIFLKPFYLGLVDILRVGAVLNSIVCNTVYIVNYDKVCLANIE